MQALRTSLAVCEICEREYTDKLDLIPRILTECGHTLCTECVTKISKGQKKILCPFDRIETTIPDGDVRKLKKNFAILQIKEEEKFRMRKIVAVKQEKKARRNDGTCDENSSHRAAYFCESCDADLCDECWDWIHSLDILAHHEKGELFKKPIEAPDCEIHSDQKAALVCTVDACKKLEQRIMCLKCFHEKSNRHFNHAHMDFASDIADLRTKILQSLRTADEKVEIIETNISKLRDIQSTYDARLPSFAKKYYEVRQFRCIPPENDDLLVWRMKENVDERHGRLRQRIANQRADVDWIQKNTAGVERLMKMTNLKLVSMRWEVEMLVGRIQEFQVKNPRALVPFDDCVVHVPSLRPLVLELKPVCRVELRDTSNSLSKFINTNSSIVCQRTQTRRYKNHYFRLLTEQSADNRAISEGLSLIVVADPFNGDKDSQTNTLKLLANASAYENIIVGLTPFNFQAVSTFLAKLVQIGENDPRVRIWYMNDPEKDIERMVDFAFSKEDPR